MFLLAGFDCWGGFCTISERFLEPFLQMPRTTFRIRNIGNLLYFLGRFIHFWHEHDLGGACNISSSNAVARLSFFLLIGWVGR